MSLQSRAAFDVASGALGTAIPGAGPALQLVSPLGKKLGGLFKKGKKKRKKGKKGVSSDVAVEAQESPLERQAVRASGETTSCGVFCKIGRFFKGIFGGK